MKSVAILILFIFACKQGGSERVDLSKKSEQCSYQYDTNIVPLINKRLDVFDYMDKLAAIYINNPINNYQATYCQSIADASTSTVLVGTESYNRNVPISEVLDSYSCQQTIHNALKAYGSCADLNDEITKACADTTIKAAYPALGTMNNPSYIVTSCNEFLKNQSRGSTP